MGGHVVDRIACLSTLTLKMSDIYKKNCAWENIFYMNILELSSQNMGDISGMCNNVTYDFFFFAHGRYQKTESAIKATAEKTTSLFGGIGSAVSNKIGALKNTESFRSMEERVTGAVSAVKVDHLKIKYLS